MHAFIFMQTNSFAAIERSIIIVHTDQHRSDVQQYKCSKSDLHFDDCKFRHRLPFCTLFPLIPAFIHFSISVFAFSWAKCVNFDMECYQTNVRRTCNLDWHVFVCVCAHTIFCFCLSMHLFTIQYSPWCSLNNVAVVHNITTPKKSNKTWNNETPAAMFIFVTVAPQKSSAFTKPNSKSLLFH